MRGRIFCPTCGNPNVVVKHFSEPPVYHCKFCGQTFEAKSEEAEYESIEV